jgi:hypothetical protein
MSWHIFHGKFQLLSFESGVDGSDAKHIKKRQQK